MTVTTTATGAIIIETSDRVHVAGRAVLVDETREIAWASDFIRIRPDMGWIVGRFVEADQANRNGHIFPLEDLRQTYDTVINTPLNMVHDYNHVVGTYVAARLHDVVASPAAATLEAMAEEARAKVAPYARPHVETIAAIWRYAFPGHYKAVRDAHEKGGLWQSMESVPKTLGCLHCPEGSNSFPYRGPTVDYCEHLPAGTRAPRRLEMPHFVGGAVIIPPVRPGWKDADVTEIAGVIEAHLTEAVGVYDAVRAQSPELTSDEAEEIMGRLLAGAFGPVPEIDKKKFELFTKKKGGGEDNGYNFFERLKLAKEGKALDDGSFPIVNEKDLKNAIKAFGRAKNKPKVKAHIIKRAKALNKTGLLPEEWTSKTAKAAEQDPPQEVLDAYRQHLEDADMEVDTPLASAYPIASGGRLWQLADSWGEWYFAERPNGDVRWVAQKMPDLFAFHVAEEIGWGKPEVRKIGWGNEAWINALVQHLSRVPAAVLERAAAQVKGVIVALVPPPDVRETLAKLGTEPAEEIHVTMVFLGKPDGDVLHGLDGAGDITRERLTGAIGAFCAGVAPVQAVVSGLGRFDLDGESEVTYASIDAPGLGNIRARLVAALDAIGAPVAREHDFTAHASIAFHKPGKGPTEIPEGLAWTVGSLEVWWSGEHTAYPLLGAAVQADES